MTRRFFIQKRTVIHWIYIKLRQHHSCHNIKILLNIKIFAFCCQSYRLWRHSGKYVKCAAGKSLFQTPFIGLIFYITSLFVQKSGDPTPKPAPNRGERQSVRDNGWNGNEYWIWIMMPQVQTFAVFWGRWCVPLTVLSFVSDPNLTSVSWLDAAYSALQLVSWRTACTC